MGLPLDQYGAEGTAAVLARELGEMLAAELGCPLHFVDERFTTAAALAGRKELGESPPRRRAAVDAQAAALILQSFLDAGAR